MRAELQRIEADAGNPLANKACVLSGGQAAVHTTSASEQELAGTSAGIPKMFVDSLPGLLGQFEPHRTSSLLLPDCCSVERIAIGSHVIDADSHHVATAQLAIDGEIEQCEIAGASPEVEPRPDRPQMPLSERGLRTD
jgi:hypothetical protein